MKRFFIAFLVMAFMASFAVAEDEGIGLTAGLEFGIGNANKANDEESAPYLMPILIYENSFLDDTLDVYAEADYTFGFTKEPNEDGDEVNPQSMYVDLMIGYNLGIGDASTLSFILENEFDEIIIAPKIEEGNALTGIFTPAIKFTQNLDFGDIYAQVGAPITYIQYYKDADTAIGLDFTLGWNSTFGLGLEAKVCTLIAPSGDETGLTEIYFTLSYETEPIYAEVETIIPKEIDHGGVTVTPEVDYFFNNFTFYVKCEFSGIGVEDGKVVASPALGVKFSF